jgi:hypothetical protein
MRRTISPLAGSSSLAGPFDRIAANYTVERGNASRGGAAGCDACVERVYMGPTHALDG